MKSLFKKILIILVLMIITANQQFLLLVAQAAEEIQSVVEENKVKAIAELKLKKYVNYRLDDENQGVLIQSELKTGIEYGEDQEYKPLKTTEANLSMPKIENCYPEKVEVIAKSTQATNGSDEEKEANYEYDSNSGEIKLWTSNDEGYNQNVENARDVYEFFAYYNSSCYNAENVERNIEINSKISEILNNDSESKIETECAINEKVTSNVGDLISTNVKASDIYNGFINSNKQNGTQNNTEYLENLELSFSYTEIADEIKVNTKNKFVNDNNYSTETNDILYTKTIIQKQDLLNILGEDGKITILKTNGEVISEVTKDTEETENGVIEIDYSEETENIIIKTTKPVKLGNINILNKRSIKAGMTNIKNKKIESIQNITCKKVEENKEDKDSKTEKEIYTNTCNSSYDIKNSETSIKVSVDKPDLTNKIQNEINITATLLNNNIKYNLFKNPVILFTFPSEVDNIILGDVSLLYDNGLSIKSAEVVDNKGCKAIKVQLNGIQNAYNIDSIVEGSNLVIPATVILKKEIESTKSTINVIYANETATSIDYKNEGKDSKDIDVNIESVVEIPKEEKEDTISVEEIQNLKASSNIQTSQGIKVETIAMVGDKTLEDGESVHEDEIIKYMVSVTNTTNSTINNIKIEGSIPDGTTYATVQYCVSDSGEDAYVYVKDENTKKYEEKIENLETGKTITKFYEVQVNKLNDGEDIKNIEQLFKIYKNNTEITNNSLKNNIKHGDITVRLQSGDNSGEVYGYEYGLWIYNNTNNDINDVIATCKMPAELDILEDENGELSIEAFSNVTDSNGEVHEEEISVEKNLEDRNLTIKIPKVSANGKVNIVIETIQKKFESGKYEYDISAFANVSYNNNDEIYYANENRIKSLIDGVQVIQTSNQEGKELTENDEIEYDVVIKNIGKSEQLETAINIQDYLPEEIIPIKAEYDSWDWEEDENNTGKYVKNVETVDLTDVEIDEEDEEEANIDINACVPIGQEMTLKIYAKADYVIKRTEVENIVTVTGDSIQTVTSNSIKFVIVPNKDDENNDSNNNGNNSNNNNNNQNNTNNQGNQNNNSTNDNNKKYNINGVVWLDSDKDGQRNNSEQLLSNIKVKLYNSNTNSLLKETTTNENGKYEFSQLETNNYMILFEYDTNNYTVTAYQKNGVDKTVNNDAIEKEVSINGKEQIVGVTNTINLDNNEENIDMGLIKNSIFDLSLNKYVTKVTVTNSSGSKEYNYKNGKLEKVEIPSKYLNNTTLKIEYRITVTNEGEVDAYASEIIDYLPNGLSFDKSLNSGWRQKTKDTIVSDSLAHTKIEAGQSKTINLILTKNMTEDGTGTVINGAEIGKATSPNNTKDIDSTENNKNKEEDDYSEAQLIISVKTGIVTYTLITIAVLAILIIIVLLIKKNKINLKQIMMFMIVLASIVVINMPDTSEAKVTEKNVLDNLKKFSKVDDMGNIQSEISSSSKYFATHSSPVSYYYNKNKLHCITPNKYMCGSGMHIYQKLEDKTSVQILSQKKMGTDDIELVDKSDSSKFTYIEQGESTYIGPFKLNKINDSYIGENFNVSTKVIYKDSSGTLVEETSEHMYKKSDDGTMSQIKHEDGHLQNGRQFYIKIANTKKSDISKIKKIRLYAKQIVRKVTYNVNVKIREQWKCMKTTGNHRSGCNASSAQLLERVYSDKANIVVEENVKKYVDFSTDDDSGKLYVHKTDADTGEDIENVVFALWVSGGNDANGEEIWYDTGRNKTTDSNGMVMWDDLDLNGRYMVNEAACPRPYDGNDQYFNFSYGLLKPSNVLQAAINMGGQKEQYMEFVNKAYSSIYLIKKDDTDVPEDNSGIWDAPAMQGVKFKIYYYDDNGNKQYISSYDQSGNDPAWVGWTDNEGWAKEFVTDVNGVVELKKIDCYKTYYAVETGFENPELENVYAITGDEITLDLEDPDGVVDQIVGKNGTYSSTGSSMVSGRAAGCYTLIGNQQVYTKISGIVWEDKHDNSKNSVRNNLYGSEDVPAPGVEVQIVYKDTNTVAKDDYGNDFVTVTDQNGYYEFKKVQKDQLENYKVVFNYNGLNYENVDVNLNNENGSKAKEFDRDNFNNQYTTIEKGVSKNSAGTITNDLSYNRDTNNHKSTLVSDLTYSPNSNGRVNPRDGNAGISILADTREINLQDYLKVPAGKVYKEIQNINLGIYEREQPDIAILKDVQNVRTKINGKEQTYNYAQRFVNKNEYGDGYDIGVKYGNKYKDMGYSRPVYKSDYTWVNPSEPNKELEVYVTYHIQIKNESTGLITQINNIADYYDARYTLTGIGTNIDEKGNTTNNISMTNINTSNYNEKYKKMVINLNEKIDKQSVYNIYVQFKLPRKTVESIVEDNNWHYTENIVELTSYSTIKNNKVHAGIDKDSAPDNITPGNKDTYEDDTDAAPPIDWVKGDGNNSRQISGKVFFDETARGVRTQIYNSKTEKMEGINSGEIRQGNGKYDNTEKGIEGIKVKLVEKSGLNLEYYTGEGKYRNGDKTYDNYSEKNNSSISEENSVTDSNGDFCIKGFIPGEYVIVYIWGENQYADIDGDGNLEKITVQDCKATIYDYDRFKANETDTYWYKGSGKNDKNVRWSDATDDYNTRTKIDNELEDIKNDTVTTITEMKSTTPRITIEVENTSSANNNSTGQRYDYKIENIDFGIVERARQRIELLKRINHLRVTLANGEVVSDVEINDAGVPTGETSHVTYMHPTEHQNNNKGGFIKVELDNELLQGALLEVTYKFTFKNLSETDVKSEDYYTYGTTKSYGNYEIYGRGTSGNMYRGKVNEADIITITPSVMVDYLDKDWGYEADKNTDWTAITKKELQQLKIDSKTIPTNIEIFEGQNTDINNRIILYTTYPTDPTNKKGLKPTEDDSKTLSVSKTLTTTDEISLDNSTETLEIEKTGGGTIPPTPGSYVPGDSVKEADESEAPTVIVTPSTGGNLEFIIPIAVGIVALIGLGVGVVIIKKKAL